MRLVPGVGGEHDTEVVYGLSADSQGTLRPTGKAGPGHRTTGEPGRHIDRGWRSETAWPEVDGVGRAEDCVGADEKILGGKKAGEEIGEAVDDQQSSDLAGSMESHGVRPDRCGMHFPPFGNV